MWQVANGVIATALHAALRVDAGEANCKPMGRPDWDKLPAGLLALESQMRKGELALAEPATRAGMLTLAHDLLVKGMLTLAHDSTYVCDELCVANLQSYNYTYIYIYIYISKSAIAMCIPGVSLPKR